MSKRDGNRIVELLKSTDSHIVSLRCGPFELSYEGYVWQVYNHYTTTVVSTQHLLGNALDAFVAAIEEFHAGLKESQP